MEQQEKAFILNKGLILGLILVFFPIIDLFYGLDMNWINYILIFGLLWMVVYSYLVVKWSKEFASYYEIFPFKDAFRTLFLISAVAFGILTIGKTLLWTVSFPDKYVELTEHFYNDMITDITLYTEKSNKKLLKNGDIDITEYENKDISLKEMTEESNLQLQKAINSMKQEVIGITFFIGKLIYRLFFFAIYCAILAIFIRKKEKFIKTN
jgi:hypothetical protein